VWRPVFEFTESLARVPGYSPSTLCIRIVAVPTDSQKSDLRSFCAGVAQELVQCGASTTTLSKFRVNLKIDKNGDGPNLWRRNLGGVLRKTTSYLGEIRPFV